MADTRTPATIITAQEPWSHSHVGVQPNMTAVNQGIKDRVALSLFNAIKLWEDTRTIHIQGLLSEKSHEKGYDRVVELGQIAIKDRRTKTTNKWGKRRWEWSGYGYLEYTIKSYVENPET